MKTNSSLPEQPSPRVLETAVVPKEILVPVDFSESSVKALRVAAAMAAKEHAHLTVLNVVGEPPSFRTLDQPRQEHRQRHEQARRLERLVQRELDPEIVAHTMVRSGDPSTEIKRTAAQEHASLIVMSRHAQHGVGRWFHRHTAPQVIDNAPCPVMIVNEN